MAIMGNDKGDRQEKKGKLGTTQIILIGGFLIVIAVIVVLFLVVYKPQKTAVVSSNEPAKESLVITKENYDEVQEEIKKQETNNMFYVSMNPVWNFKDSDSFSDDAIMEDSELNYSNMFITVELLDTKEVIYESPVMSPGSSLSNIKLSKKLEAGTYQTACVHHVLFEDGTEETTVQMALTINVLN